MDLKNIAKQGVKMMAIKKGAKMSGGLLKMGAVAGVGYLGYKLYKKKFDRPTTTV